MKEKLFIRMRLENETGNRNIELIDEFENLRVVPRSCFSLKGDEYFIFAKGVMWESKYGILQFEN